MATKAKKAKNARRTKSTRKKPAVTAKRKTSAPKATAKRQTGAKAKKKTTRRTAKTAAKKKTAGKRKAATKKGAGRAAGMAAKNVTPEEARFIAKHADKLSKTTQRAKWVRSPSEHEDKPGQSLATRSHDVIQRWAKERGAKPATVARTEHEGRPGVLRFNFPGYGGRSLQEIEWDQWFSSFDDRELVFVFQEHKRDGSQSNFFQLDNPRREHA